MTFALLGAMGKGAIIGGIMGFGFDLLENKYARNSLPGTLAGAYAAMNGVDPGEHLVKKAMKAGIILGVALGALAFLSTSYIAVGAVLGAFAFIKAGTVPPYYQETAKNAIAGTLIGSAIGYAVSVLIL